MSKLKILMAAVTLMCFFGSLMLFSASAEEDPAALPLSIDKLQVNYQGGAAYEEGEDSYYFTPSANYSRLNSVRYSVNYTISGGDTDHEPGSIVIRIPAHIFETRDSTDENRVYADIAELPFPTEGYVATLNEAENCFVITNSEMISKASIVTFDVQYVMTNNDCRPSDVADMTMSSSFYAEMVIKDEGCEAVTARAEDPVRIIYNTEAKIKRVDKSVYQKSENWPGGNWGDEPADAEAYFYVVYKVLTRCTNSTQPFTLTVTDTPQDGGEVVAYLDNEHEEDGYKVGMSLSYEFGVNTTNDLIYSAIITSSSGSSLWDLVLESRQVPQGNLTVTAPVYGIRTPKVHEDSNSCITWVLVRYPKELVADGRDHTFTNTVTATCIGADGIDPAVQMTSRCYYTYKTIRFAAPSGTQYSLRKSGGDKLNGALDSLDNGYSCDSYDMRSYYENNAMVLGYPLTLCEGGNRADPDDYGQRSYTVELIDDLLVADGDYENPLGEGDYEFSGMSFYIAEYDYQPDETRGEYVKILCEDPENYPEVTLFGKKGASGWEKIGVTKTSGYNSYINACYYSTITLEDGSGKVLIRDLLVDKGYTGVKLSYQSTAHTTEVKNFYVYVNYLPSDKMCEYVAGKEKVTVTNVNTLAVTDDKGVLQGFYGTASGQGGETVAARDMELYGHSMYHGKADTELGRFVRSSTMKKTTQQISNDTVNKRISIIYDLLAYEVVNGTSGNYVDMIERGYVQPQNEATFYDLLPIGVEPDPSTISLRGYYNYNPKRGPGSPEFSHTYEVIQNYNNTGRTLFIVHVKLSEDSKPNYYTSTGITRYDSGINLSFTAYYSYDDLSNYGTVLLNSAAYETGNRSIGDGQADTGGSLTDAALLSDLNGDGNPVDAPVTFLYAENTTSITAVTLAELSLMKKVKGGKALTWTNGRSGEVTVSAASRYYYDLYYGVDTGEEVNNVILYDSLENYLPEGVTESWHGVLEEIDLSQVKQLGAAPVVYYSTVEGLSIEDHTDITDTSIWSTEKPENKKDIRAIAIDLRKKADGSDFSLKERETISIILTMSSPTDHDEVAYLTENKVYAYNNTYLKCDKKLAGSGVVYRDNVTHYEYTQVGLATYDARISKRSDPKSGTKEEPKVVSTGSTINYTVYVGNGSSIYRLTDYVVEDVIPDGLQIHFDQIKYYDFYESEARLISTSSTVSATIDGQKLTFTGKALAPTNSISFIIPVTVEADGAVFENTAVLKSVNGFEVSIKSETTYHKTEPILYSVYYHVEGDEAHGIPDGGNAPDPDLNVGKGSDLTLKDQPSTVWKTADGTAEGIPGTWTFEPGNGWSETEGDYTDGVTNISAISNDRDVYGKWVFTPDTYKVTYIVIGDPVYGTPSDGTAPTDENNPYAYKAAVVVKDDLTTTWTTSDGSAEGIRGTWTFASWDHERVFAITEDTTITGKWTFVPDKEADEETSETPSEEPSETPSEEPSETPSEEPSETPSEEPSETPSEEPSEIETEGPSEEPTELPTEEFGTGNLQISKKVSGEGADRSRYFVFIVSFDTDGSYEYTGSKKGTITSGGTIELKHGETVTIHGIPAGTSYTVKEVQNSGYFVKASGDSGVIRKDKTSVAEFTNSRSELPATGDNNNRLLWLGVMAIALIGTVLSFVLLKKEKRSR